MKRMIGVLLAMVMSLIVASTGLARTTIEENGFFIDGLGYVEVRTVLHKNPWGVMTSKTIGLDDKGNLYDLGSGSSEGWVNGAFKGSVAGGLQGAGVATGMALLRPSSTNVNNNSGSGDTVSATGGTGGNASQVQGQAQGQLQGQAQCQTQRNANTFIPTNINNVKATGGGWIPPGQNK